MIDFKKNPTWQLLNEREQSFIEHYAATQDITLSFTRAYGEHDRMLRMRVLNKEAIKGFMDEINGAAFPTKEDLLRTAWQITSDPKTSPTVRLRGVEVCGELTGLMGPKAKPVTGDSEADKAKILDSIEE